jgi:hypothetical protein
MNTTDRKATDPAVSFTRQLIQSLIRNNALDTLELKPREKEVISMRWEYNLTKEQMAKSLGLSVERTRQIYDMAVMKICSRLSRAAKDYSAIQQMKEKIQQLEAEVEFLNKRFDALKPQEKAKVAKADVLAKKVSEIGLPKKLAALLIAANLHTLGDLIRSSNASLFAIPGFGVSEMRVVESVITRQRIRAGR